MTRLLEQAVLAARDLPAAAQDDIARFLLDIVDPGRSAEALPEEHRAAIAQGLAEADRGEFASDDEVAAAFRRFER